MALRYYDDIIIKKIQRWLPEAANIKVLKPDETNKFFRLTAEENQDSALTLPLIALSRKPEFELLTTTKSPKSYDGLKLSGSSIGNQIPSKTALFNVLPIRPEYQLDIYTKTAEEGEEYVRNFLFKLINNPALIIEIPYNNMQIEHIANIRVLPNVADTSAITERLFSGQFTRWTIQFEIHDAFLFSIPYRRNWVLKVVEDIDDSTSWSYTNRGKLELVNSLDEVEGELEDLDFVLTKVN